MVEMSVHVCGVYWQIRNRWKNAMELTKSLNFNVGRGRRALKCKRVLGPKKRMGPVQTKDSLERRKFQNILRILCLNNLFLLLFGV